MLDDAPIVLRTRASRGPRELRSLHFGLVTSSAFASGADPEFRTRHLRFTGLCGGLSLIDELEFEWARTPRDTHHEAMHENLGRHGWSIAPLVGR